MIQRRALARNDVVLAIFPFTDLSARTVRPALIVGRVSGAGVLVAFITSRVGTMAGVGQQPSDHLVDPSDAEFAMTGLKSASVIRLDKLATIDRNLVRRRIGRIGGQTERAVVSCLRYAFEL